MDKDFYMELNRLAIKNGIYSKKNEDGRCCDKGSQVDKFFMDIVAVMDAKNKELEAAIKRVRELGVKAEAIVDAVFGEAEVV